MSLEGTGGAIEAAAAEVRASIEKAERAAAAEGIDPNGVLGGFVEAFKWALLKLADLIERFDGSISGRMAAQERQIEALHRLGEAEVAKLKEANRAATLAIVQAEVAQRTLIAGVCKEVAASITSDTSQWLVVAEQNIHVRRARIYALKMTLATMTLIGISFWGGYEIRAWQDEPAVQSLARCMKAPMRVVVESGRPTGDWACKLETLVPRSWGDLPAEMQRRWLSLWRYATG